MKILQVIPYFTPAYAFGGPVTVVYQISRELAKRGHEVVVYTTDAENPDSRLNIEREKIVDGFNVYYMRNLSMVPVRKSKIFITTELVSIAKEQTKDFDVIHLHECRTFQNVVVHHYAKKHVVPYVLQAHGSIPRIMTKQMLKWLYDIFFGYRILRDASKVIALTLVEAHQYRDMGVPKEKIAIIPNGIDLSEYDNLPPKGKLKEKLEITGKKIILFMGRLHKIKGIDFLLKAYAEVVNEMKVNDALLVIAGPDDGYLSTVKYLINQLKLQGKVLLTGPLHGWSKLQAYVDADVYVLPSRYETFPMGLLEAYACGKPVITSKLDISRSLVVDGVTGVLVNFGDVEQLTYAILSLLDDPERAKEMGLKSRKLISSKFPIEKTVDAIECLYEDLA